MHDQIAAIPCWLTRWVSIWGGYTVAYLLQWLWFVKIMKGAIKVLLVEEKSEKKTA
jgi:hypothetical protein